MIAWSEMTHTQRAWMLARLDDEVVAKAHKLALSLEGEYHRAKRERLEQAKVVAIAKFDGVVVKCEAGSARGVRSGKSARALPIQFYGPHGI